MEFNILNLALVMFITGLGSFGGGIGAINVLKEFIFRNDWLSYAMIPSMSYEPMSDELVSWFFRLTSIFQYNGYSQGIMMSTYLGAKFGILGVVVSVLAFILPSVLIVVIIFKIGQKLYKNEVFKYSLKYMNLLGAGLIGVMLYNFIVIVFGLDPIFYIALAGLACYANIFLNINPAIIIIVGGIVGGIFRA